MSQMGQTRRLSCLGMSASPPTSDVWLRRSELTLRANRRHARQKEGKNLKAIAYFVSAAICWSNQARSRFQLALCGESFTKAVHDRFSLSQRRQRFPSIL